MPDTADFNSAIPRGTVSVSNEGGLVQVMSDLPDTHQIRLLKEALAWLEMPETPPQEGLADA